MGTSSINKTKGLATFPNYISSVPEGSLTVASNVVIDRDNILEPRRGMKVINDLPEFAKQLLNYKDRVFVHYGNSLGFLDLNDPANLTILKGTKPFQMTTSSTTITIIDHGLVVGDNMFFTKTRDYSQSGTAFFPFPSGINEVSQFVVTTVIDKDSFQISTSVANPAISLGLGHAILVSEYSVIEVVDRLRVKSIELNSNLYVTSSTGVKKVTQLNTFAISDAGGVQALGVDLSLNFSGSGGFFGPTISAPVGVEVAYRVVWGTKDYNKNLILGVPSERTSIQNITGQNTDVNVSFVVPAGITTDYFYQIYRTNVSTVNGSGDEMRLVLEVPYDGYSTVITVTDSTPEVIRDTGVPLYTNEFSGEGILQANNRPPVCQDICQFKNRAWFANTRTTQKLDVTFLGFDGFKVGIDAPVATGNPAVITLGLGHGVQVGTYIALANTTSVDGQYLVTAVTTTTVTINANSANFGANYVVYRSYITIAKGGQINRYFFVGKPEITNMVIKEYNNITAGNYFNLTSIDDKIKYSFWFSKNVADVQPIIPGRVLFKVNLTTLTTGANSSSVREKVKDAINLTGDFSCIDGVSTTPTSQLIVTTATSGAVTDPVSATQTGTSLLSIAKTQDGFGENAALGFARLSSYASPATAIEDSARSLVKTITFTPSSAVNVYYLSTTTSLPGQFFLEEKNISSIPFTITGTGFETPNPSFNPSLDSAQSSSNNIGNNVLMFSKTQQPEAVPTVNAFRIGPQDKAIKRIIGLRDSLFILKEEGVYRLTGENEQTFNVALFDNSATIIAADSAVVLNNQIYCLTTQGVSTISETGVGVISRPIENIVNRVTSENFTNYATATFGVSYEADRAYVIFLVVNESDTTAQIAYRYNTFTQTWTSFDKSGVCGVVSAQNKLHLGVDDIPAVEQERKKLVSRDYVDRSYARSTAGFQQKRLYVDTSSNMEVGDALIQDQYLTIGQYNALILRLKIDPQLGFSQTFTQLTDVGGADFIDAMTDLVVELNLKDISRVNLNVIPSNIDITTDRISYNPGLDDYLYDNDIVKYTAGSPNIGGLTNNQHYQVTNIDVALNTFQLTTLDSLVLTQPVGGAIGLATLTRGSKVDTFNLALDIDFATYYINITQHGFSNGDVLTFNTINLPAPNAPNAPSQIVDGKKYRVINATPNSFQLKTDVIDITTAGNGNFREVYYYDNSTVATDLQREFNLIVSSLNTSNGVFFSNFDKSVGNQELDMIITYVDYSQNFVNIQYKAAFYIGDLIHYKGIQSEIIWSFFTLGDPSLLKHVSTGSVMVEQNSLNKITVGYASDLSGDFENTEFILDGDGSFGRSLFGNTAMGGNGTAYPLRTIIPRQKQRCRHIRARVFHSSCFMKFNIIGISYDYEVTSTRAYRR